ncbi:MAG: HAMP domain-containing histidine kinase [Alphaproteobacteria bacterium]|nr:HAMP domain-containing histidine kinase [Alphaproteobacteria bacterium]
MKIPFKVSARTARLIGRENVATSKGAIIELVKNGYDADSKYSIIYLDNQDSVFHDTMSVVQYDRLIRRGIDVRLLESLYQRKENYYLFSGVSTDKDVQTLVSELKNLAELYIIDCGEGMTRQIIENHWMTIGTDNKSNNFITSIKKRVKAGAKGIGRFALDKLGESCEMITVFDPKVHSDVDENGNQYGYTGYLWKVNWGDFEGTSKTIDAVEATLEGISRPYIDCIKSLSIPDSIKDVLRNCEEAVHGTILKISNLRDSWDETMVSQLFDDLGVLVPPSEDTDYSIILRDSLNPEKYGSVESAFCDDYDYKISAHATADQNVKIRVFRNEYDVEAIPPSFFARDNQQKPGFTKLDFTRGYWDTERTFAQLVPGFKDGDINNVLHNIGAFDFTFYYLKRSATRQDESRFYYRHCAYNLRKDWLDKFGGIKLFRDGFRVRPYGERNDSAFDWLGLGARKQKSPAGIAKPDGGYKVEVENVAGSIMISRLTNIDFEDKSSREGLQENQTFSVFKRIIQGIIGIFEVDRATIAREMSADDYERNGEAREREQAELLAKKIIENRRNSKQSEEDKKNPHYRSMTLLAALNDEKDREIEQLREEQKVLRALASSGLMLASFSHDLSKLNISMNNRYDKIKALFLDKLSEDIFSQVEDRKNPYLLLERARQTDEKMQNWLNFSTSIIKKDKRRRRNILLDSYFEGLDITWNSVFESRNVLFNYSGDPGLKIRAFEIDFDSIFYNLFSNSIEAFARLKVDRQRTINVDFRVTDKSIRCEYRDSGPGLSPDIINPEEILQPLFTTKRNRTTGEEIGTGLGMWIVNLVAKDYDASVKILSPDIGFAIVIDFPKKYENK